MKKITDLSEIKVRYLLVQETDGTYSHEPEEYEGTRDVRMASVEKRIIHYFLDGWIMTYYVDFSSTFIFDHVIRVNKLDLINVLVIILVNLMLILSYFVFFEYFFHRTPAKFLTSSVVIDEYAGNPSFKKILIRSLVRLIPFEAFSYLGDKCHGWHDRWSGTYVVPIAEKEDLLNLLRAN